MWPYPKGLKLKLIKRAKYNKITGCLEWVGNIGKHGYGKLTLYGIGFNDLRPHKAMLELKLKRSLKYNMESIHDCDNTLCISVAKGHVREGLHIDNMAPLRRGRHSWAKRYRKS